VIDDIDEQRQRARAAREALIGNTIAGRYTLRALLGHGGMGAVYEAEHLGLGKRVAVKFVDPEFATDEQVVARFAREARAMSAIESAHIVTVFDAGKEDGRPYLVMELLRGEDLGERLRRVGRVPIPEAMHIVAQVLKGLARAHAAGIVHRDLKPDNVFLVKHDTDPLFAKIVDFGISKIDRPRANTSPLALTGRGTVLGTPFYMSPEQAQASSEVDGRTDLYSAGAILFECLTGRPPHTGESYEQVILSICMTDAPVLSTIEPSIPRPVCDFVARALARDRTQRFTSAERMLAALHEVAPAERTRVPLATPSTQTMPSPGLSATMLDGSVQRDSDPSVPVMKAPVAAATRLGVGSLDAAAVFGDTEPTPRVSPMQAQSREPSPILGDVAPALPGLGAVWSEAVESRRVLLAEAEAAAAEEERRAKEIRAKERRAVAPPRSSGKMIATAAVAIVAGLGVTYAAIHLVGRKGPEASPDPRLGRPSSAEATSATVPSALPSGTEAREAPALPASAGQAQAPDPTEPAAPLASSAPAAPSVHVAPSGRPRNNGSPPAYGSGKLPPALKPPASATSTKPLDIQRDLP